MMCQKMMKIIAIDSWTEGAHHFARLVEPMRELSIEVVLIHFGSWGHDEARPMEETLYGILTVRDISYYGGRTISEILDIESPELVMFLSIQAFAHRAVNRYCMYKMIPTAHMYHGLVAVQPYHAKRLNPINIFSQIKLLLPRVRHNLHLIIPTYIESLIKTKASSEDWLWLCRDVWRKVIGTSYSGHTAPDCKTTICCVYADCDREHAVERYGLDPSSVKVVGNPDLIKFGLSQDMLNKWIYKNIQIQDKFVVYIDNALVEAGAVFASYGDYLEHLKYTRSTLACHGYNMLIKLHPIHSKKGSVRLFADAGFDIVADCEFTKVLMSSAFVITEPSSASMLPALLGCPLLLARYGKLIDQEYGPVLSSYPRAKTINSLTDVHIEVDQLSSCNSGLDVDVWVCKYSGPLPANLMPVRVTNEIYKCIQGL